PTSKGKELSNAMMSTRRTVFFWSAPSATIANDSRPILSDNPPSPACQYRSSPSTLKVMGPTTGGNDMDAATAAPNLMGHRSSFSTWGVTDCSEAHLTFISSTDSLERTPAPTDRLTSFNKSYWVCSCGNVVITKRRPSLYKVVLISSRGISPLNSRSRTSLNVTSFKNCLFRCSLRDLAVQAGLNQRNRVMFRQKSGPS